jgi:hypothetical protein
VDKGVLESLGAYKAKIYYSTLILIPLKWEMEFHLHTYASLLVVGAILAQNITRKSDQPVVYASKLHNNA